MILIDASAIVAVMTREEGWNRFADCIQRRRGKRISPIAVFEAAQAIARKRATSVDVAARDVLDFLEVANIELIEIASEDGLGACLALHRFGKGRHPAALNMGDCFAYASAKRLGLPLLYKGDDFALTDLPSALDSQP